MRPYEVMVIFDTGAEPPAIQAVVDRALETIRANDGVPGQVDRWGRRPFAYELKHRREGYYVLMELSGVSQTVSELDRLLSLADEVLRHKVIRLPEKPLRRSGTGRPGTRGSRPGRTEAAPAGDAVGETAGEARGREGRVGAGSGAPQREAAATGGPAAG